MSNLLLVAALAAPAALLQDDPTPVGSEIVEVTVYPGSASVRRTADLPAGGGSFVLEGLPRSLDRDAIRVRSEGAEIVGVDLRDRIRTDVPDERVAELRGRVRGLERDLAVLRDEASVLEKMETHLDHLLRLEERTHGDEVSRGRPLTESWEESFAYLQKKLTETRKSARELGWRMEDAQRVLEDARLELGRFESTRGVQVYDLLLDVLDTSGAATTVEVEYVVANAGWSPSYDLRAPKDLSAVDLAYRAKVWQRTGEDWRDVDLLLSTAQPLRGAQGPEPRPVWLSLLDPRVARRAAAAPEERRFGGRKVAALKDLAYADEDGGEGAVALPVEAYAQVASEGLSVRFRLARKETIESRAEPTSVLIGRCDLSIRPEHVCVPALDTTVWLRARAVNTSEWTMLPGRASVYFGADFIGHAQLPAVQRDEELTLHLGPDPGLSVERVTLKDETEGSGIFSSKETLEQRWRIRIENNGAFTTATDGSVAVIVHEVLPRSKDDRIQVEIRSAEPALDGSERWRKEREEKGVLTWTVRVPKGGERTIELATRIAYPEDMEILRR